MPGGRKPKTTPGPSALRGFDAPNHGDRSRLEQTMAAGGGRGGGGGGAPTPTPTPTPTQAAPPLPFVNPMYDEEGNLRPGGSPAPATPAPFPDDPDLFLKAMYRVSQHPDVLALLEPRTRPHLYEGVDVGSVKVGGNPESDPFMELPTDPLISGPATGPPPPADPTIPPNPSPPPPDPSTPLPPAPEPGAV